MILVVLLAAAAVPAHAAECADLWSFLNTACRRVADTYRNGTDEFLVSGYSWHTPWTWTPERRREENERAWGAGWARTVEKPNGDTDTVYALVFSDSHSDPQYNVGYAWSTFWRGRDQLQPGLGYTAIIMSRTDIAKGWPFPAVLPLFSLRYGKYTLVTTYIPNLGGGINHGSVFYVFGKIVLD